MRIEHFDEPAHVRAFKFFRQIDKHADRGDGVLRAVGFVANLNRETQAAHTHLIDAQFAGVALVLLIVQSVRLARRFGPLMNAARSGAFLHDNKSNSIGLFSKKYLAKAFKHQTPSSREAPNSKIQKHSARIEI